MKYLHKFSATWCQPCRTLSNSLKDVDLESLGIVLVEHDVDLMERTALQHLGVRGVPTVILMDDGGAEIARKTGAMGASELTTWLGGSNA